VREALRENGVFDQWDQVTQDSPPLLLGGHSADRFPDAEPDVDARAAAVEWRSMSQEKRERIAQEQLLGGVGFDREPASEAAPERSEMLAP
jgi:hypothetical protein